MKGKHKTNMPQYKTIDMKVLHETRCIPINENALSDKDYCNLLSSAIKDVCKLLKKCTIIDI